VPLADCLGSFFALAAPLPVTGPPAASSAPVLDQLPPLALGGRPLADLLRPAYASFSLASLITDTFGHVQPPQSVRDHGCGAGGAATPP
jgi:hypothetical protein